MPHLHYMAATTKPSLMPLIAAITSERAQDMAAAASAFVDSCTAQPLPYAINVKHNRLPRAPGVTRQDPILRRRVR